MRAAARNRLLRFAAALWLPALALAAQAPARITRPVDLSQTVRLRGNTPVQLRTAVDRGAAPPQLALAHMLLVLRRSRAQQAALDRYLDELREQDTGRYHAWLTPSQFGERFGPAASDIAKVTAWLSGAGFQVERVAAGRGVIEFSGTAGTVAAALHTTMHRYLVNGRLHWANAGDPAIPAALAPVVAGVASLNDFRARPMLRTGELAPAAPPPITPQFNIPSSTGGAVQHAITPGDLDVIYDLAGAQKNYNGAGETIAIAANTEISTSDFDYFRSTAASAPSDVLTIISADGTQGNQNDTADQGEATLDAEWAGAAAPYAQLDQVVASDTAATSGIDLSAEYIVDHDLAPIVTVSYGYCEAQIGAAGNAFWNSLWQQAAAEGITVLVAAGDTGAAGCDSLSGTPATSPPGVNAIASTPYDTAVGGTEFNDTANPGAYWNSATPYLTSALGYIPETAWSEADVAGNGQPEQWLAGGGGPSAIYAKPPWQSAAGVPADGFRDLPDVALTAATHDGYVMCFLGSCVQGAARGFYVVGGTSASTPAMAGIMALVDQAMGGRQGLINPVLYRLAADPGVFHDITSGANDVPCQPGSSPQCVNGELGYSAAPGYDLATGLGSVDGTNLVNQWGSVTFAQSTTTLQLGVASPQNLALGQSVPVSVQVAGAGAGAPPTGTVELLAEAATGTTAVQTLTLNPSGDASATTTALPAGSYNLVASYGGDGTYGLSTSAPIAVAVDRTAPAMQLELYTLDAQGQPQPVTEAYFGLWVYAKVIVTGGATGPAPTGTVTISDSDPNDRYALAGTFPLPASGLVTTSGTAWLLPGSRTITASYSGDGVFATATATASLVVGKPATSVQITGYTDTQINVALDIAVPYTSAAAGGLCDSIYADDVGLYTGGAEFGATGGGTGTNSGGQVQCELTYSFNRTFPGTSMMVSAQFPGNQILLPSSAPAVPVPTPPNLAFTPASLNFGMLTPGVGKSELATLSNGGGQAASQLRFQFQFQGPSYLGVNELLQSDTCGKVLAAGASCTVTVTLQPPYAGPSPTVSLTAADGYELPGGAVAIVFATPYLTVSGGGAATISPGQAATFLATVSPVNGFAGPISLSCYDLPPLASCSFAPAAPTLDGTHPVQVQVTVTTAAMPAARAAPGRSRGPDGLPPGLGWAVLAAALALAWLRRGPAGGVRPRRAPAAALIALVALAACGGGPGGGAPATGSGAVGVPAPGGSGAGSGTGTGAGTSAGSGTTVPRIAVSPLQWNFGDVGIGLSSAAETITIANQGTVATPITVAFPGPDSIFAQTNTCPSSPLAPGAVCTAAVVFSPNGSGAASADLLISEPGIGAQMVVVNGQGIYVSTPKGNFEVYVQAAGGGASASAPVQLSVQ